ncbi:MAG: Rieske 2Fe-2S domain-containing protein, partial [Proteobacteria bacterium]|nr:Rieske 2Fe-2S domain-containing protein [Pseudomonadota bacterium]
MLSREENELLTRVGPGTPMGALMRRYWIPAVPSDHIAAPDSPPVRVRLLGENLVAFRDSKGRVGLLDERCPHRTASLFFGRNEDCGLRCVYHGWKFDVNGDCTDLPSEPPGSTLQRKVRAVSYPCVERGGLVWTYMGPAAAMPAFPDLEWTRLPPSHRHQSRQLMECNWLQGIEGGFDASHLSFLHGGVAEGDITIRPWRYEVVPTEFGFIAGSGRPLDDERTFWTANVMVMPFHKIIASAPVAAHVWAPVDDENTMQYCVTFSPHRPFTEQDLARETRFDGIHAEMIPGTDRPLRNPGNDYLIDRDWQASGASYTGIKGLGTQDNGIQESMGAIADRTIEHLGISDTALIQLRRFLLKTVRDFAAGSAPP